MKIKLLLVSAVLWSAFSHAGTTEFKHAIGMNVAMGGDTPTTGELTNGCEVGAEKVSRETLFAMITNNDDVTGVCTSAITDMSGVFLNNTSFNQDIGNWDTSNVITMESMFRGASDFNHDISNWDVSSASTWDEFRFNSDLSTENTSVRFR